MAAYDPSQFERPSVTVDVVLLALFRGHLHTLLIRRSDHPFQRLWALPGGFIHMDESLGEAAARVLGAKTGLHDVYLEQLGTFGEVKRDPRTRVLSVAYYALVDRARFEGVMVPAEDSVVARMIISSKSEAGGPVFLESPQKKRLHLAFDHQDIIGTALKRVRGRIDYTPVGFELLPTAFTLLDLQNVHETVLGRKLNKDSFRRRMLSNGQIEATGEIQQDVDHRPAALYRFIRET